MSKIGNILPSGRVSKLTQLLPPYRDSEDPSLVLMGSSTGYLGRILNSGAFRSRRFPTVLTSRILQLPGVSRRIPNAGSSEAYLAKSENLVTNIISNPDAKLEGRCILDLTSTALFAKEALWRLSPVQRHAAVIKALSESIKNTSVHVITMMEMPTSDKPIAIRLSNVNHLETILDHVLFEMVSGKGEDLQSSSIIRNGQWFFLTSENGERVTRIDTTDPRTNTRSKLIKVLRAVDRFYAGSLQDLTAEEIELVADTTVDQAAAKAMADAVKAPDTAVVSPEVAAEAEQAKKRAEAVSRFSAEQRTASFPTRSGATVEIGNLIADAPVPELKSKVAAGKFLNRAIAEPKFDAITLSYLESGAFDRDTAAVITSLSDDPVTPFFASKIERIPASDNLNHKETLVVTYKDMRGRTGTVRVDVPIISRDGYLFLNGVKWNITKQILAQPIIKVRPDEVLITTAYNKATVARFGQNASPKSVYARQLGTAISKSSWKGVTVEMASATAANAGFENSVEYDDIARSMRSLKTSKAAFVFGRTELNSLLSRVAPWAKAVVETMPNSHTIGWLDGGKIVLVSAKDGSIQAITADGKEVKLDKELDELMYDAVVAEVGEDAASELPAPSVASRKYAYSRVKMLSQYLPTAVIVGYGIGLVDMMKKAGIEFRIVDKAAFKRSAYSSMDTIVFSDAVVAYNSKRLRDLLLMNGLKEMDTEDSMLNDFAPGGMGWVDHISDRLGSPGHAKALVNFQTSFIDPMTKEILKGLNLPTDFAGVLLYASAMLEDNAYSEANDLKNYRIRGPELVNSILYKVLHKEMERVRATRESASPQKLNVPQNEVIRQLKEASNVEEVSELNPLLEVELRGKVTWTGAVGGLGDGRTVNRAMRAYHPSMFGMFGYYSPDSSEIGVKRTLTYNTSVKNVRGHIDVNQNPETADRILAVGELISPFTAQHDDSPRIGMQSKQGTHTMPILRHTPMLIGSGMERSIASSIGSTFAYKARADGKVVKIDHDNSLVQLQHSDGSTSFIDISPRSIKNSGGGFYITSQLELDPSVKVGTTFKKDEILALDPSFFSKQRDGSTAYKAGVMVRMALTPLDQTYEDSLMVTKKLTEETVAKVTLVRSVNLGSKANLQKVVKVNDLVEPNSPLATFENVTDDADISNLLQRVGKEFDEAVAELTKNTASAKYAGKIIEIKVFYNKDLSELSPSLQSFIKSQERISESRRKAATGAPADEPVRVSGPMRVTRDKVGGEIIDGVLIQFYIQVTDVAGPGDKFVCTSPLKGVVSRVFEEGEEPVDETGHQIDYIVSPLSVCSRMTVDVFLQMWGNSVLVGLKESVLSIADE